MEKKFKALRFIGGLYKVIAIIILVVSVLGIIIADIAMIAGGSSLGSALGGDYGFNAGAGVSVLGVIFVTVFGLLIAGLASVSVYAMGELVTLLLALEENTRYTALILRDRPQ